MRALQHLAAARAVAATLRERNVPVLVLKGAPFQQRFLGNAAAYPSLDLDLLVPRRLARAACDALTDDGWVRPPDNNALLWRLSESVNLDRDGVTVDLHWGVHAGPLPAWSLRGLTAALWRRATLSPDGLYEPRAEELFVYLAAHAAGHGFDKERWDTGLRGVAAAVRDWGAVASLAKENRLRAVVAHARQRVEGGAATPPRSVLDGGAAAQAVWAAARGRWVPLAWRDRLRRQR
jgi:hypothetical protein